MSGATEPCQGLLQHRSGLGQARPPDGRPERGALLARAHNALPNTFSLQTHLMRIADKRVARPLRARLQLMAADATCPLRPFPRACVDFFEMRALNQVPEFASLKLQQLGSDSDNCMISEAFVGSRPATCAHARSLQSDTSNTSLCSPLTTPISPSLWVIAARGHIPTEYYVAFTGSRGLRAFPVRKWHCPAL